jgi:hypothetical protein
MIFPAAFEIAHECLSRCHSGTDEQLTCHKMEISRMAVEIETLLRSLDKFPKVLERKGLSCIPVGAVRSLFVNFCRFVTNSARSGVHFDGKADMMGSGVEESTVALTVM